VQKTHNIVLAGLAVVIASGVLLFAADLDAYLVSKLFWIKMALVVALMINGAILTRAERRLSSNLGNSWGTLQWTAIASLSLWFLTTFIGTALPNIG
jgi:predicted tellurium resistance membrane protein TerC